MQVLTSFPHLFQYEVVNVVKREAVFLCRVHDAELGDKWWCGETPVQPAFVVVCGS